MADKNKDLAQLVPPKELDEAQRDAVFQFFMRRLASHRNSSNRFSETEAALFSLPRSLVQKERFQEAIDRWAQELLQNAWAACQCPGSGKSISV